LLSGTMKENKEDVLEALRIRNKQMAELRPKWEEAKLRFEELDGKKRDMERDIQGWQFRVMEMKSAAGEWCDQDACDFDPIKYGKNPRYDRPAHGYNWYTVYIDVQCPACKRHNVTFSYERMRINAEVIRGLGLKKGVLYGGYYYCEECGGMMV
jgi:hypothetical protein